MATTVLVQRLGKIFATDLHMNIPGEVSNMIPKILENTALKILPLTEIEKPKKR